MANKRNFTGRVTKVHGNFGFIDEDVFFQSACCDGRIPAVGDSVLVDAQYNPAMPFKWNATRVKALPKPGFQVGNQQHVAVAQLQALNAIQSAQQKRPQFPPQGLKFVHSGGAGLLGAAPSNAMGQRMNRQRMHGPKGNRPQSRGRQPSPQNRNRDNRDQKRRRTPSQTKGSPPRKQRDISKDKSDKNQKHPPAPRYMVQYTKRPLTLKTSDMLGLKGLHTNMYIPSDFYAVNFDWQVSFGLEQSHTPRKCHFHILHKDVETLVKLEGGLLNPPDSDHSWVAKVMLLEAPPKDEIYKQCCRLAEESSEHFFHQSRTFKFLVGSKGKKELMAIGGSWSPSLDGPDPAKNPHTLVNTAIRTCKALTGIDLSKCTSWRRMLEIQYHRDAEVRKGRNMPDRVETTVVFLPDIHSCMATSSEYSDLCDSYRNKCEAVIQAEQEEIARDLAASQQSTTEEESPATAHDTENVDDHTDQKDEEVKVEKESTINEPKVEAEMTTPVKEALSADDSVVSEGTPTHHMKLDVKIMKVQLLRKELDSRGLSPRGLKAALVTRLSEALQAEAQKELDDRLLMDDDEVEMKVLDVADEKDESESKANDPDTEGSAKDGNDKLKEEESKKQEQDDGKIKEVKATPEEKKEKKEKDESVKEEPEKKPKKVIDTEKLKQLYALPVSQPVIPVHPNSEFKSGSFECSVVPLSKLLGYRHEDNKESIFEVSLFAEAFSEMLQCSHAFNIYKALRNPLPELSVVQEEDEKEAKEDGQGTGNEDEEPPAKKSKKEEDGGNSEEDKKPDKDVEQSEKTKSLSEDGEDSKKEGKSSKVEDPKSKKQSPEVNKPEEKMVTLRKDLLLSFVYFDQTQCGYIKSSDMADIIHSIGLALSRSQITSLLSKYLEHGNLMYRNLTDVPAAQLQAYQELLENTPKADLGVLASGNKSLKNDDVATNGGDFHMDSVGSDGIVDFNGAVVDIKALQDKLSSSEEDQANMETKIGKLTTELDSTSKVLSKTLDDKEKLQSDYDVTKKKLSQTQDDLKSVTDTKTKFEKTLKSIAKSIETAIPKEEEK